jgi:hypothetical protein
LKDEKEHFKDKLRFMERYVYYINYCWMLKRGCKDEGCARKSKKRKFEN